MNELELEAKARDAEDVVLGAQLKELRTILAQELETLGKACTEELAGEATTRDAEDTALRVLLEELQASIADFATRPWCEEHVSAIQEKLSEKLNEVMMVMKQEAQEREAADLNLRLTITEDTALRLQEVREQVLLKLDEVVMQETHRREAADLNLREAFTDELALEAKVRDAEDVALGAQLKERRVILAQDSAG